MLDTPVISIIDDEEPVLVGTLMLLRSLGFAGHTFSSARAFLKSEQLTATSCLISDIQMPDMNGIQLQDTLRARGYNIPIIFVTAFPDDKIRSEALSRGAICFLSKPLDGEVLLRCLNTAFKEANGESG